MVNEPPLHPPLHPSCYPVPLDHVHHGAGLLGEGDGGFVGEAALTREYVDYTHGGAGLAPAGSFNAEVPTAGYYRTRLRSGGHPVGVRIWFGAPLDPIDGTELDRSHRWQALANDRPIDLDRVWPSCGRNPIDETEYHYLAGLQKWGEQNAPNSPQANPFRRINPLTSPTPF